MRMYDELADWWPLLSAPEEYADEASLFNRLLRAAGSPPQTTLLELVQQHANLKRSVTRGICRLWRPRG
jgi:hypothetical protein